MKKRETWTQASPTMQQITIVATLEKTLNAFQTGELAQAEAIQSLKNLVCQLAELQPFLEKGCWDDNTSKLLMQSDDQVLSLIFDRTTPPDKINDLLYKIKQQLDRRNTRRVKRIKITDSESSDKIDLIKSESPQD